VQEQKFMESSEFIDKLLTLHKDIRIETSILDREHSISLEKFGVSLRNFIDGSTFGVDL